MKHSAAYSMLVLGGNANPSAEDVERFMRESGIRADPTEIGLFIEKMGGRNFHEVVEEGMDKIADMRSEASVAVELNGAEVVVANDLPAVVEEPAGDVYLDIFGADGEYE